MKKFRKIIVFNLYFILFGLSAQPGPYSGTFSFRLLYQGHYINNHTPDWEIIPHNFDPNIFNSERNKKPVNYYAGYFIISPAPTPMGGMVSDDFYIEIIHRKDTMRVYPPSFKNDDVKFDIRFKTGTYKIPEHIYRLNKMIAYNDYVPKLDDDWEVFKQDSYVCYLEKISDIDACTWPDFFRYDDKESLFSFDFLPVSNDSIGYIYYDQGAHFIIAGTKDINKMFQLKTVSDLTFWGQKNYPQNIQISSLYVQNEKIYAILVREYFGFGYDDGNYTMTDYGIYQLHFFEKEFDPEKIRYLYRKEVENDYKNLIKSLKNQSDDNAQKIKQITRRYEKFMSNKFNQKE